MPALGGQEILLLGLLCGFPLLAGVVILVLIANSQSKKRSRPPERRHTNDDE